MRCLKFSDSDIEQNKWISTHEKTIFQKGTLPEKTFSGVTGTVSKAVRIKEMTVQVAVPAMFALQDGRRERPVGIRRLEHTLTLYDLAGEKFVGEVSAADPSLLHMVQSEALLFLFDPAADAGFRQHYADAGNGEYRDAHHVLDQGQVITNAIATVLGQSAKRQATYTRPVVVMLSKADTLAEVFGEVLTREPFMLNERHEHILDLRYLLAVSYAVREMIKRYSPVVFNAIEAKASDVLYIPVSALGHSPIQVATNEDGSPVMGPDPARLRPSWVDVPLLYVLYKAGYLEGRKTPELAKAPEPQILERTPEGVSFLHPATRCRDFLPAAYTDIKLRCPFTQAEFMIRGDGQ